MNAASGTKTPCAGSGKSMNRIRKKIKTVSNANEVQLCPDYNP